MNASDYIDIDVDEEMPFELIEHAKAAVMESLPLKSKDKYNRVYKNFKAWQLGYGVNTVSATVMMAYFHMLDTKKHKPTSLWAFHSMLKATLRAFDDIDIGTYAQVSAFLKVKSSGYKSIKAQVFTENNIKRFIDEADDLPWLDVKVSFSIKN